MVIWVRSDGDSTDVRKTRERYRLLAEPGACDMRIPSHHQEAIRQQITLPGNDAGYCIDIDHQGKSKRLLDGQ
jgi:hypothetical protein